MAFDRSLLLTYLAVILVAVAGAVIFIEGDVSENTQADDGLLTFKTDLEVGDYYELDVKYIHDEITEEYTMRYEVAGISETDEYIVNQIKDGELLHQQTVDYDSFIFEIYNDSNADEGLFSVSTKEVETAFGMVLCDIYDFESPVGLGYHAHIGAGTFVVYYEESFVENETGSVGLITTLTSTSLLI